MKTIAFPIFHKKNLNHKNLAFKSYGQSTARQTIQNCPVGFKPYSTNNKAQICLGIFDR
jgi:hypothetical protein